MLPSGPRSTSPPPVRNPDWKYKVCPYDKSHIVSEHRIHNHVSKCRLAYLRRLALAGETPFYFKCKYYGEHCWSRILQPEVMYHTEQCREIFEHPCPPFCVRDEPGNTQGVKKQSAADLEYERNMGEQP